MRPVSRVSTASLMLLIMSCDAYQWPPYESQLRTMFVESKPVLIEIEAEMIADGLIVVGRNERLRTDQPRLTEVQAKKYKALFERLQNTYVISRSNGTTFINMSGRSPRGMGKDFSYTLVHGELSSTSPSCNAAGWTVSCGTCEVDLGEEWSIQYMWYPKDLGPEWDGRLGEGLPTGEDIQKQFMQELHECRDAGLREMGIDPSGK